MAWGGHGPAWAGLAWWWRHAAPSGAGGTASTAPTHLRYLCHQPKVQQRQLARVGALSHLEQVAGVGVCMEGGAGAGHGWWGEAAVWGGREGRQRGSGAGAEGREEHRGPRGVAATAPRRRRRARRSAPCPRHVYCPVSTAVYRLTSVEEAHIQQLREEGLLPNLHQRPHLLRLRQGGSAKCGDMAG